MEEKYFYKAVERVTHDPNCILAIGCEQNPRNVLIAYLSITARDLIDGVIYEDLERLSVQDRRSLLDEEFLMYFRHKVITESINLIGVENANIG